MIQDLELRLTASLAAGIADTTVASPVGALNGFAANNVLVRGENIRSVAGTANYGTNPLIAAGRAGQGFADHGIGEKIHVIARFTQVYNTVTTLDLALIGCDNDTDPGAAGVGTNEVVLCQITGLSVGTAIAGYQLRLGMIPPATLNRKKCLRFKLTPQGAGTPTTGSVLCQLVVGDDSTPDNIGRVI